MNAIPLLQGSKSPEQILDAHMEWTVSLVIARDYSNLPQGFLWVCMRSLMAQWLVRASRGHEMWCLWSGGHRFELQIIEDPFASELTKCKSIMGYAFPCLSIIRLSSLQPAICNIRNCYNNATKLLVLTAYYAHETDYREVI